MTQEVTDDVKQGESTSEINPPEKQLPQSEVNRLIGEAKAKTRSQVLSELQKSQQNLSDNSQNFSQQSSSAAPKEDIRKIVSDELALHNSRLQEEAKNYHAQQAYQRAVNEVTEKVKEAEKRIPDYAETLANVGNFQDAPGIVMLANSVDNTGDVLYELAKNPAKAGAILAAFNSNAPLLAKGQIVALSKSIKQNNEAKSDVIPDEPLSQPKPTNISVVGKAPKTASDFAKSYKGRY